MSRPPCAHRFYHLADEAHAIALIAAIGVVVAIGPRRQELNQIAVGAMNFEDSKPAASRRCAASPQRSPNRRPHHPPAHAASGRPGRIRRLARPVPRPPSHRRRGFLGQRLPPSQGRPRRALRPPWPSWIAGTAPCARIKSANCATWNEHRARGPNRRRCRNRAAQPGRSDHHQAALPAAKRPMFIKCQSVGKPLTAAYWHWRDHHAV